MIKSTSQLCGLLTADTNSTGIHAQIPRPSWELLCTSIRSGSCCPWRQWIHVNRSPFSSPCWPWYPWKRKKKKEKKFRDEEVSPGQCDGDGSERYLSSSSLNSRCRGRGPVLFGGKPRRAFGASYINKWKTKNQKPKTKIKPKTKTKTKTKPKTQFKDAPRNTNTVQLKLNSYIIIIVLGFCFDFLFDFCEVQARNEPNPDIPNFGIIDLNNLWTQHNTTQINLSLHILMPTGVGTYLGQVVFVQAPLHSNPLSWLESHLVDPNLQCWHHFFDWHQFDIPVFERIEIEDGLHWKYGEGQYSADPRLPWDKFTSTNSHICHSVLLVGRGPLWRPQRKRDLLQQEW